MYTSHQEFTRNPHITYSFCTFFIVLDFRSNKQSAISINYLSWENGDQSSWLNFSCGNSSTEWTMSIGKTYKGITLIQV